MSGPIITVSGLAKRYGRVEAVREVSFEAHPGAITGLVGPNGAGKSTTLRIMLGLVAADAGSVGFDGRSYRCLADPSGTVGAVLDLARAHPGMTARRHLCTYATIGGHPAARVGDVLDLVGLAAAADQRVGGFSTGMRQRLALATALVGAPAALVLDEPTNGLDPTGVVWLRRFLRDFADAGGTVLLSSHVLAELQQSVDEIVVITDGHVAWSGGRADLAGEGGSLEELYLRKTETAVAA
jgi:ABC-2 type transport system ATP-binding protein